MDEFSQLLDATPGLYVVVTDLNGQRVAGKFVALDVEARTVDLITTGGPRTVAIPEVNE